MTFGVHGVGIIRVTARRFARFGRVLNNNCVRLFVSIEGNFCVVSREEKQLFMYAMHEEHFLSFTTSQH